MRARKPSDPGSGRSSGRLGLAVLVATVAAFLLVPVTQAAASGILKVNVIGKGSGTVTKNTGYIGSEFECSYSSPGPATGECEPEMKKNGEGNDEEDILSIAGGGSEVAEFIVNKGKDTQPFGPEYDCENKGGGQAEMEEFFGGWFCALEGEAGEKGAEITVCFALTGEGKAGCVTKPKENNVKVTIETGSGSVVSSPAGLECSGEAVISCEGELPEGKVVLTASPAPGYAFKSWKKCDSGGVNGRQCTITANKTLKEIGVSFIKVWNLKGTKSGGLGILGSSPGGVNCGYACSSSTAFYKEGSLTVKAKPAKNFHFVEFSGGTGSASGCTGTKAETCTFTIAADSSVNEVYAENAKNTLSLVKEGGGQGFVKTKPTNINCGYNCTAAKAEFFAAESPEVTVALGKGTSSVTWVKGAGTCTGNALTCTVPMSSSHELVAKFN